LDLWKDLFAVPGDISSSQSWGTNTLIKKWEAKCITESMDILEEYDVLIKQSAHKQKIPLLDTIESQIYQCISWEESDIDSLVRKLNLESRVITMKLSLLELKNIIKKDISWKYVLV
jgi:DNA processing protein